MSQGVVRIEATVERLARPPVSRWPVKVTIQLGQRNRRGSRLTAKVGRQWLEGVVATSSPPGLVGFLTQEPRQGDPIVLVDGMLELGTGLRYGAAPAAQSSTDDEVFLPPDESGGGAARALSDEEDPEWYEPEAGALQAPSTSCTVRGRTASCGTCTATEQRISGAATNLVQVPAAHVVAGARNDQMNDAACHAFVAMRTAAIAAGALPAGSDYLKLVSGYRDYPSQVALWRAKMQAVFGSFGCTNWAQLEPIVQAASQALSSLAPPHPANSWLNRFRQELRTAGVSPQGCNDGQIRAAAAAEDIDVPAGAIDVPSVAVAIGRKTVAPPGSSPHHTGRAVDLHIGRAPGFSGTSSASTNVEWQRRQTWYRWLVCNAAQYGYHPYNREPWHWEYTPPAAAGPSPRPVSSMQSGPADDVRDALQQRGLTPAQVATFEAQNGVTALVPIVRALDGASLLEMLRLLPYEVARLVDPWHSYDTNAIANRTLGSTNATRLAPRLLLTIPALFRERARRTRDPVEAFIIESLGWLVMSSVASDVRAASFDFWLPPSPHWVTAVPNPLPAQAAACRDIIMRLSLIDTALSTGEFNGRAAAWLRAPAGRQWFFETGQGGQPAGRRFYRDALTTAAPAINIPAAVNIGPQRAQVQTAWNQRVTTTDQDPATPANTPASVRALTTCRNIPIANFTSAATFPQLALVTTWPLLRTGARPRTSLSVLTAIQPAFQAAMRAIAELGWNDLLYQTAGTGCFRGTKIPGNVAGLSPAAARRMSNHSLAIAADFNDFENKQPRQNAPAPTNGTMDARLVALFDAFNFRWGAQFTTPDPMHFEYR